MAPAGSAESIGMEWADSIPVLQTTFLNHLKLGQYELARAALLGLFESHPAHVLQLLEDIVAWGWQPTGYTDASRAPLAECWAIQHVFQPHAPSPTVPTLSHLKWLCYCDYVQLGKSLAGHTNAFINPLAYTLKVDAPSDSDEDDAMAPGASSITPQSDGASAGNLSARIKKQQTAAGRRERTKEAPIDLMAEPGNLSARSRKVKRRGVQPRLPPAQPRSVLDLLEFHLLLHWAFVLNSQTIPTLHPTLFELKAYYTTMFHRHHRFFLPGKRDDEDDDQPSPPPSPTHGAGPTSQPVAQPSTTTAKKFGFFAKRGKEEQTPAASAVPGVTAEARTTKSRSGNRDPPAAHEPSLMALNHLLQLFLKNPLLATTMVSRLARLSAFWEANGASPPSLLLPQFFAHLLQTTRALFAPAPVGDAMLGCLYLKMLEFPAHVDVTEFLWHLASAFHSPAPASSNISASKQGASSYGSRRVALFQTWCNAPPHLRHRLYEALYSSGKLQQLSAAEAQAVRQQQLASFFPGGSTKRRAGSVPGLFEGVEWADLVEYSLWTDNHLLSLVFNRGMEIIRSAALRGSRENDPVGAGKRAERQLWQLLGAEVFRPLRASLLMQAFASVSMPVPLKYSVIRALWRPVLSTPGSADEPAAVLTVADPAARTLCDSIAYSVELAVWAAKEMSRLRGAVYISDLRTPAVRQLLAAAGPDDVLWPKIAATLLSAWNSGQVSFHHTMFPFLPLADALSILGRLRDRPALLPSHHFRRDAEVGVAAAFYALDRIVQARLGAPVDAVTFRSDLNALLAAIPSAMSRLRAMRLLFGLLFVPALRGESNEGTEPHASPEALLDLSLRALLASARRSLKSIAGDPVLQAHYRSFARKVYRAILRLDHAQWAAEALSTTLDDIDAGPPLSSLLLASPHTFVAIALTTGDLSRCQNSVIPAFFRRSGTDPDMDAACDGENDEVAPRSDVGLPVEEWGYNGVLAEVRAVRVMDELSSAAEHEERKALMSKFNRAVDLLDAVFAMSDPSLVGEVLEQLLKGHGALFRQLAQQFKYTRAKYQQCNTLAATLRDFSLVYSTLPSFGSMRHSALDQQAALMSALEAVRRAATDDIPAPKAEAAVHMLRVPSPFVLADRGYPLLSAPAPLSAMLKYLVDLNVALSGLIDEEKPATHSENSESKQSAAPGGPVASWRVAALSRSLARPAAGPAEESIQRVSFGVLSDPPSARIARLVLRGDRQQACAALSARLSVASQLADVCGVGALRSCIAAVTRSNVRGVNDAPLVWSSRAALFLAQQQSHPAAAATASVASFLLRPSHQWSAPLLHTALRLSSDLPPLHRWLGVRLRTMADLADLLDSRGDGEDEETEGGEEPSTATPAVGEGSETSVPAAEDGGETARSVEVSDDGSTTPKAGHVIEEAEFEGGVASVLGPPVLSSVPRRVLESPLFQAANLDPGIPAPVQCGAYRIPNLANAFSHTSSTDPDVQSTALLQHWRACPLRLRQALTVVRHCERTPEGLTDSSFLAPAIRTTFYIAYLLQQLEAAQSCAFQEPTQPGSRPTSHAPGLAARLKQRLQRGKEKEQRKKQTAMGQLLTSCGLERHLAALQEAGYDDPEDLDDATIEAMVPEHDWAALKRAVRQARDTPRSGTASARSDVSSARQSATPAGAPAAPGQIDFTSSGRVDPPTRTLVTKLGLPDFLELASQVLEDIVELIGHRLVGNLLPSEWVVQKALWLCSLLPDKMEVVEIALMGRNPRLLHVDVVVDTLFGCLAQFAADPTADSGMRDLVKERYQRMLLIQQLQGLHLGHEWYELEALTADGWGGVVRQLLERRKFSLAEAAVRTFQLSEQHLAAVHAARVVHLFARGEAVRALLHMAKANLTPQQQLRICQDAVEEDASVRDFIATAAASKASAAALLGRASPTLSSATSPTLSDDKHSRLGSVHGLQQQHARPNPFEWKARVVWHMLSGSLRDLLERPAQWEQRHLGLRAMSHLPPHLWLANMPFIPAPRVLVENLILSREIASAAALFAKIPELRDDELLITYARKALVLPKALFEATPTPSGAGGTGGSQQRSVYLSTMGFGAEPLASSPGRRLSNASSRSVAGSVIGNPRAALRASKSDVMRGAASVAGSVMGSHISSQPPPITSSIPFSGSTTSASSAQSGSQAVQSLSLSDTHNQQVREAFAYRGAPSVLLFSAILRLVSDKYRAGRVCLQVAQEVSDAIGQAAVQGGRFLLLDVMQQVLTVAKIMFLRDGQPESIAELPTCDAHLAKVDLTRMLVAARADAGVPPFQLYQPPRARQVVDRLVQDDRMQMALEVAMKCNVDPQPIWVKWGLACLRLGLFEEAREKFRHVQDSSCLSSILQALETHPAPHDFEIPTRQGMVNMASRAPAQVQAELFDESVYYLSVYGKDAQYVAFYLRQNRVADACKFIFQRKDQPSVGDGTLGTTPAAVTHHFLEAVYKHCATHGSHAEMRRFILLWDPTLLSVRDVLFAICKHLSGKKAYAELFDWQRWMCDFVRAARTALMLFQEEMAPSAADRRRHWLEEAKTLFTKGMDQPYDPSAGSGGGSGPAGVLMAKPRSGAGGQPKNEAGVVLPATSMDQKALRRYLSTISLQMEVMRVLPDPAFNLFDPKKIQDVAERLISGNFELAFSIMQEFRLPLTKVCKKAVTPLIRERQEKALDALLKQIKPIVGDEDWDELLLEVIGQFVRDVGDAKTGERYSDRLVSDSNRVRGLVRCQRFKEAYILAANRNSAEEVTHVLHEAEQCPNQTAAVKGTIDKCRKFLQQR
eukprot:TRINITY_DN7980_c0_g1_i3.p1 TRINITY_DN7980_c0_g1~~TRINITY_DN7980_c0_g1_i3.p1  ORF type:complete len:2788 (+),score=469.50 TRINITY_DN7980_c0_g1_i3:27-8366(+)